MLWKQGINPNWLLTGEGPMTRAAPPGQATPGDVTGPPSSGPHWRDFAPIPRYDVAAAAGHGAFNDRERIIDHIGFSKSWIRNTLLADPDKLVAITAIGDSMTPTICNDDLLLVDTAVQAVKDDAIYVLVKQDGLVVKRIQAFLSGAVVVKSENPAYAEETLGPEETAHIRIAGRVRWFGRKI